MDRLEQDKQKSMEERIKERREQILEGIRKKKNKKKGREGGGAEDEDADNTTGGSRLGGKGEEQVRRSRRELSVLASKAQEEVTRFRIVTDAQENDRRGREETLHKERRDTVKEDANNSFKSHGHIQMSFEALSDLETKVPQEYKEGLMKQQEDCTKVIAGKDNVVAMLRGALRDKEEEYVRTLKQEAEQIDALIATMHVQTDTMTTAYANELNAIEEAYVDERTQLLAANAKLIKEQVQRRSDFQNEHKKEREATVAKQQKVLEDKYEENAEKFNKSKMDNLRDIHGLSQELQTLRARYLLNSEKLNYSLQVLRERVKENKRAGELHRKKIGRLTDLQSTLIARQQEAAKKFENINTELTESYRRVTEQYKDLQLKFQHFEKADVEKHQQVWNMHEQECMKLVHKCLQGDRVIYEELMGVAWVPPSLDFWAAPHQGESDKLGGAGAEGDDGDGNDEEDDQQQVELGENADTILQILYDQVPFLVEEKDRKEIDEMEEDDAHLQKVRTVLGALEIKTTAEVRQMMEFFTSPTEDGLTALINPQEAVRALKNFLEDRSTKREMAKSTKLKLALDSGASSPEVSQATKKLEEQRKQRQRETDFWDRMANVVPQSHVRVWTSMEMGLEKYLKQLQQRQNLIDETDGIRKQNDELRALLNQYLSSQLNEELYSPPQLQVAGPASKK